MSTPQRSPRLKPIRRNWVDNYLTWSFSLVTCFVTIMKLDVICM